MARVKRDEVQGVLPGFSFFEPHTLRVRVGVDCSGPGRTMQEFKDECDINRIVRMYARTGDPFPSEGGTYADVSELQRMDLTQRVNFSREVDGKVKDALRSKREEAAKAAAALREEEKELIAWARKARAAGAAGEGGGAARVDPF